MNSMHDEGWFLNIDGTEYGPYTVAELWNAVNEHFASRAVGEVLKLAFKCGADRWYFKGNRVTWERGVPSSEVLLVRINSTRG